MFDRRLCVPNNDELKRKIMAEAHETGYTIHPGETKMYQTLRSTFWWRNMHREIATFVAKCLICQKIKAERRKPSGLLQPLRPLSQRKFDVITMDFVTGFPRSKRGCNAIWVIVDTLTKMTHFIPYRHGMSIEQMTQLYIKYLFKLHGAPTRIISDRDTRFTSRF